MIYGSPTISESEKRAQAAFQRLKTTWLNYPGITNLKVSSKSKLLNPESLLKQILEANENESKDQKTQQAASK